MPPDELLLLLGLYGALNIIAFSTFAFDKQKSRKNARRTSEKRLLFGAFLGPFGALLAMRLLRHKTRKTKFLLVYLFCAMHIVVIGSLLFPATG